MRGVVPDEYVGEWECCKLGYGGWSRSYLYRRDCEEVVEEGVVEEVVKNVEDPRIKRTGREKC